MEGERIEIEIVSEEEQEKNVRILLTIDTVGYMSRPDRDPTMARIYNRMTKNGPCLVTLTKLRELIENGHTWSPGAFTGRITDKTYKCSQLAVLDFEEEQSYLSYQSALDRCAQLSIPPCLGYFTFSHTDAAHRFRLLWRLDAPLGNEDTFDVVQLALLEVFSGAVDTSCKNACHLYYGTNKACFHYDPSAVVSPIQIVDALGQWAYMSDPRNAARTIRTYASKCGVGVSQNGLPMPSIREVYLEPQTGLHYGGDSEAESVPQDGPKTEDQTATSMYYIIERAVKSSTPEGASGGASSAQQAEHTGAPVHGAINLQRGFRFDQLELKCQCYRELMSGAPLPHDVTFGLATSLLRVEGGEKHLREGLALRDEWADGQYRGKWTYQIKCLRDYISRRDYQPEQCLAFCTYEKDCEHAKNPLQQASCKRGQVRRIADPPDKITLETAEARMLGAYRMALSGDDKDIWILNGTTGIGKTELYLQEKDAIIAVSTHNLAVEVAQRCKTAGNDVLLVPELPSVSAVFSCTVEAFYKTSQFDKAKAFIREEAKHIGRKRADKRTPAESDLLKYVEILDQLIKTRKTVVVTHARLLYMPRTRHRVVIVDEDLLATSVTIGDAALTDVTDLRQQYPGLHQTEKNILEGFITAVEIAQDGVPADVPENVRTRARKMSESLQLFGSNAAADIIGLLTSDTWFASTATNGNKRIYYSSRIRIPDRKLIVMSTTAREDIWRAAAPSRTIHCPTMEPVEMNGKLIQYVRRGYSRHSLFSDPEKGQKELERLKEILGDTQVLTYKSLSGQSAGGLNVIGDAHFGKLLGIDRYRGQDLVVLGTPNLSDVSYYQYASALGICWSPDEFAPVQYRLVRRNGFEFYFCTFPPGLIRDLQLWLVESELVQAVGRARLLREACTVVLLSNYPLPDAEIRHGKPNAEDLPFLRPNIAEQDSESREQELGGLFAQQASSLVA